MAHTYVIFFKWWEVKILDDIVGKMREYDVFGSEIWEVWRGLNSVDLRVWLSQRGRGVFGVERVLSHR